MSQPSQKPDLDESINVTDAHSKLNRESAAVVREKRIVENGLEPISLGVFAACGFVLLIAGAVFGQAGRLFSYQDTFRPDYVRSAPPGGADQGPVPTEALAAFMARGNRVYSSKCNGCHGSNAQGDGANFPSLVGSDWVVGDTQTLAMVILNGLQGPTSTGRTYGNGVMAAQGAGMTAADLAGVMTYLRNSFGNSTGDVVTIEMARAALEASETRERAGQPVTAEEIAAFHSIDLPGDPLDPSVLVDPISLTPAEAE